MAEPGEGTQQDSRWFRGDCHVHSIHSDGELTVPELAAEARTRGLDFLATTDHNTAAAHQPWRDHVIDDDLLVLLGAEVTTADGHWLALGVPAGLVIDWHYVAADDVIEAHVDQVHASGGICVIAHPRAPYPSGAFRYPFGPFDCVEVWNGTWNSDLPWQADNEAALSQWENSLRNDIPRGRWRAAMGNSDAHLSGQIGAPHTVVAAEGLSAAAVLTGITRGRSWIAAHSGVEVSFTVNMRGHSFGIGERMNAAGASLLVRATVAGVPFGVVSVHTEDGRRRSATLPDSGSGELQWSLTECSLFLRLEVRTRDGSMAAFTNPIIVA